MAAPAQVTWVKVANNGAEVVAIGGIRKRFFGESQWHLSTQDAITLIEQDEWRFFVEVDEEKEWLDVLEAPDGKKTISVDGPVKVLL